MTEPQPSLIRRLAMVRKGETRILLWAAGYFFFLLMSYYLLRPMREAFGIARGADKLPWLMTATLATMLLVNPVYAALVSRVPRRRFIPLTYRFFALSMGAFWAVFRLAPGRVHEAEGPGRRAFALHQATHHPGPVVWVLPGHAPEHPLVAGLPRGVGARLHLVRARSEAELLWATEEALRTEAVSLVIAEPERALGLVAGRRLQLAAGAGRTTGLLLIPQGAGSNATDGCARPASRSALLRYSAALLRSGQ